MHQRDISVEQSIIMEELPNKEVCLSISKQTQNKQIQKYSNQLNKSRETEEILFQRAIRLEQDIKLTTNQSQMQKYQRVDETKRQFLLKVFHTNPHATIASLSKAVHLSRSKVTQIKKEYQLTGNIRTTIAGNSVSLPRMQALANQNKAILEIVSKNMKIGLQELSTVLEEQYGIKLRRSCIHKRLTQQLGYSFASINTYSSAAISSNAEETILQRGYFCKSIQSYSLQRLYACGVYDVALNTKESHAWLPKNFNRADFQHLFDSSSHQSLSVRVIATISSFGLIKYDFFTGEANLLLLERHFRGISCHYNSSAKVNILMVPPEICEIISKQECDHVKIEGKIEENHENVYNTSQIKNYFRKLNISYILMPLFSPMLNPCYHFFGMMQKKFKAYRVLKRKMRTRQQIIVGLTEIINLMPAANYIQYFARINEYLKLKEVKVSDFMEYPAK